jgi:hypothetical protein
MQRDRRPPTVGQARQIGRKAGPRRFLVVGEADGTNVFDIGPDVVGMRDRRAAWTSTPNENSFPRMRSGREPSSPIFTRCMRMPAAMAALTSCCFTSPWLPGEAGRREDELPDSCTDQDLDRLEYGAHQDCDRRFERPRPGSEAATDTVCEQADDA